MGANADSEERVILEGFLPSDDGDRSSGDGRDIHLEGRIYSGPIYSVPHGKPADSDSFDNGGSRGDNTAAGEETSLNANTALRIEPRWKCRFEYLAKGSHDASLGF